MNSVKDLTATCEKLLEEGQYEQLIALLPAAVLQQHQHHCLYTLRGRAHARLNHFDEGMKDCETAIMLNGKDAVAWRIVGSIAAVQKNLERAEQCINIAISLDETNPEAYLALARVYFSFDQMAQAQHYFEKVLQLQEDNEHALLSLGHLFYRSKKFKEALPYYEQLLDSKKNYGIACYEAGQCHHYLDNNKEALVLFDRIYDQREQFEFYHYYKGLMLLHLGSFDDALKNFNTQLITHPDDTETILNRGKCYHEIKQYGLAILDFNRLMDKAPENPNIYYLNGTAHHNEQRIEEAILLYKKFLKHYPDNAYANLNLGSIYQNKKELPVAKAYFDKVIATDPDFYEALISRSEVHFALSLIEQAKDDACKAITLQPMDFKGYMALAQAYIKEGNNLEALPLLLKALEYSPPEHEVRFSIYACIGIAYYDLHYYHAAIEYLDQAIDLSESPAWLYDYRSKTFDRLKQRKRALEDITTAIDFEPRNGFWFFNRSRIYFNLNEYHLALPDASQAILLMPEQSALYSNRAAIYYALTQFENAFLDIKKAMELDPQLAIPWLILSNFTREFLDERMNIKKENCWYRFVTLLNTSKLYLQPHLFIEYSITPDVINSLLKLEVPMITIELLEINDYNDSDFPAAPLRKAFDVTRDFRHQFKAWKLKRDHPNISMLAEAVMQFYLGNPPATLKILSKQIPELNCMAHMYRIQAAMACLEPDMKPYISEALPLAEQTLADDGSSLAERYYAAIILDLADQTPRALQELEKLSDENYAAAVLKHADIKGRSYNLVTETDWEDFLKPVANLQGKFMQYFHGIQPAYISGEESQVLEEITDLVHAMENSHILAHLLRQQHFRNGEKSYFAEEFFFARHVKFEHNKDDLDKYLSRHRNTHEYRIVFGTEIDKKDLAHEIANCTDRGKDAFLNLGEKMHEHSTTAYFYRVNDYNDPKKLNMRKYLVLISNLFETGVLTADEAHLLHQYAYYCLQKYAENTLDDGAMILIGQVKDFIDKSYLLNLGYGTLESIFKYCFYKIKGKDSPILSFKVFLERFHPITDDGVAEEWG